MVSIAKGNIYIHFQSTTSFQVFGFFNYFNLENVFQESCQWLLSKPKPTVNPSPLSPNNSPWRYRCQDKKGKPIDYRLYFPNFLVCINIYTHSYTHFFKGSPWTREIQNSNDILYVYNKRNRLNHCSKLKSVKIVNKFFKTCKKYHQII